ncbi:MAG TPA: type I restriction enzyme HsdR N-terminal domain-containing protein [Cytophagaceae bacterium]|nr:type I restriction enzyme HsdR N-terminal domain-containing protein [Cytophagaceae bacterium]
MTPEEWVRQHFIHLLLNHYNYPKALIKIEGGLRYNKLLKRSDILVFDREGNPFLLVECKSADQKINQSSFDQAAVYNMTKKARYLAVTNGLNTYCCSIDHELKKFEFIADLPALP